MRRGIGLLIAALAVLTTPAAAQRAIIITDFGARIVVNKDASVDVTETITARFNGQWNGIYRTVPVQYHTLQGLNWSIRLSDISATTPDGEALRVEHQREGHYEKVKIWVPGAQDASRTIALHYKAANALRYFDDHDELYWNITGDEWDVAIGAVSAEIVLPDAVEGVRATSYNGVFGSRSQDATVTVDGHVVRVSMPKTLGFHEGVTAVVGWNPGVVTRPTATEKARNFLADNLPLLIPLPIFFGMAFLWWKRGRDPSKRPITVQYEPPTDVTPAEAGVMIDERVDPRDVTATLVDLAVKGHIRIEETEEAHLFGLFSSTEYVFHKLRPAEPAPLQRHELLMLDGLFENVGVDRVELSELQNKFYRNLAGIRQAITRRLVEKGRFTADPAAVRSRWRTGAIVLTFLIIALGGTVGAKLGFTPLPFFIAALLSGLIVGIFGHLMPARTEQGTRSLEQVLGFQEFLARVDKEHYARVVKTPEMFEKFLPYAMAFGVERNWARAFRGILREPPRWYSGGRFSTFDANVFTSRMSALSSSAGNTMSSSPRSSGGSGFGGGGSSGGGGGGGGGGGF